MISQVFGALLRAFLVVTLVTLPSLLVPGIRVEAAQIVVLFALFIGVIVCIEYASRYPGLVEFRYAPPYNRIRFLSLFISVLLLTVIVRGQAQPSSFSLFAEALGALIGASMDFAYSPVRLVLLMLPETASPAHLTLVRTLAGMSYLVSIFMLIVFVTTLRIGGWPARHQAFNVWVNLPTFDPTAGGDVVERLERDSMLNIALGFLLPFLIPAILKLASEIWQPITLIGAQTMIWTIAAWAFLPACLLMRGVALGRIARMIREKRREHSVLPYPDLQPV